MDYIGTWVFHSIAAMNDDESGFVYLSAEDYLKLPMPYVDETDEDAVADEMKERKKSCFPINVTFRCIPIILQL